MSISCPSLEDAQSSTKGQHAPSSAVSRIRRASSMAARPDGPVENYKDLLARLMNATEIDDDVINKDTFRSDAERLRHRLRELKRGWLNPNSIQMQRWDLLTMCALFYTMFVTPYECTFMSFVEQPVSALFVINQVVNLVFMVRARAPRTENR
eukprot:740200-Prymnesium_polylepis.1